MFMPADTGLLPTLTREQNRAAQHTGSHARVVAVAGAGKTATLLHYLHHRLQQGADPGRILVLMYNRAVQQSFTQRLAQFEHLARPPKVHTFHALGLRIYRRLIERGHLPERRLEPLGESVVEWQLKQLLQQHAPHLDGNSEQQESLSLAKTLLGRAKAELRPFEALWPDLELPLHSDYLQAVYHGFESWRQAQRRITYDDMLWEPAQLFQRSAEARAVFTDHYDEILVDEYQDINPVQHFLLQTLAGNRAQVMVIGDPDQTIYEFRGSSPDFIQQTFAQDFIGTATYHLPHTFRFGHSLALAANHLIRHNPVREPLLTLSADTAPYTRIHTTQCQEHGQKIATAISQLHAKGASYQGMAVLCRLWSYIRPVELQLLARGIPYRIQGEQSILQCAEIRPLLHALQLMSGQFFDQPEAQRHQALFELLSVPSPKIPHALLQDVARRWAERITPDKLGQSLQQALPDNLSPFQTRRLLQQIEALNALQGKQHCAQQLLQFMRISDMQQRFKDAALNPNQGAEQAATLRAFMAFLLSLKLDSAADVLTYLQQMQGHQTPVTAEVMEAVTLTTIHRSKGLEWPAVFLPNVSEGHLPCFGANDAALDANSLQSERRLMYVAITRARKHLFITLPDLRSEPDAMVSRFIDEMRLEQSCVLGEALEYRRESVTLDTPPDPLVEDYLQRLGLALRIEVVARPTQAMLQWSAGDPVHHSVLGKGHIQAVEQGRLHIRFNDGRVRVFAGDVAEPLLQPL